MGGGERERERNRSERDSRAEGGKKRRERGGRGREGRREGGERERFVQKVTSKIEETKLGNLLKSG